jgi:membrane protease YdiL (CAAX protease family)
VCYRREIFFWILLLPAFSALGSMLPRRQAAGLVETVAFLFVAISSTGKLKSLGLEFAHWNPLPLHAAVECVVAGVLTGGAVVALAKLSIQPLGAQAGWNRALLAIVLGPVVEEVIFRGYLMTAALQLAQRLPFLRPAPSSIIAVALLFAVSHRSTHGTTALQFGCIAATGCLYGYLRLSQRSTVASVLAHGAYNLTLYVSYWFSWAQ